MTARHIGTSPAHVQQHQRFSISQLACDAANVQKHDHTGESAHLSRSNHSEMQESQYMWPQCSLMGPIINSCQLAARHVKMRKQAVD